MVGWAAGMGVLMSNTSGRFLTSREACDRAGYARPDSLLRAWRAAGLPVYKRPSGRNVVAVEDFERFIAPDSIPAAERPVR